ncbi:sensor histidine kinase [Zobellella endophytica]|uniref:sensor histidine kinase n=1 Tax=Zobellella endophytica TaxID=2116700 RepID=UPI001FEB93FD|nr:ATP-binding protein [Zobellella endophytica]
MNTATSPRHPTAAASGRGITLLLLLLGMVLLGFLLVSGARTQALEQIRARADANLSRYIINLQHQLDRHKDLPRLLASQQQLIQLLLTPEDAELADRANRYLAWVNDTMGATDSYLIGTNGITLAASNWDQPRPFIGNDYSFRPYFQQAMEGGGGRYFALGNTSRVRGYFFSYPVTLAGEIIGVTVVKVDLEDIEEDWNDPLQDILVMDEDGVIFISTRAHWRFRTLSPQPDPERSHVVASRRYGNHELSQLQNIPAREPARALPAGLTGTDIERIAASQRYGDAPLLPLDVVRREATPEGDLLLTLIDSAPDAEQLHPQQTGHYLLLSRLVPDAGMRVAVLASLRPLEARVFQSLALGLTFYLVLAALVLFLHARHRLKKGYEAELQLAHEKLEQRVQLRTRELTDANQRLQQEIELHHQTQNQLIQTAKLALLGQLSAGINHELNQPLTAIRHYADNGRKLLERGKTGAVATNLEEIAGLAGRMAAILQPLKEFARQNGDNSQQVSLQQLRQGVMVIMGSQLEQQNAHIFWPEDLARIRVQGDIGRLEQVLVNLISNALQAMAGQPAPLIEIGLNTGGQRVALSVRDHGPGLADDVLAHIFEPFYTTKSAGLGLGLSISHRIAHSLEGELSARNHPQGGAIFTLALKRGQATTQEQP